MTILLRSERERQAELDRQTLEEQLEHQIAVNERLLAANAKRPAFDVAALQEAARRDYGPTARQLAAFEVATCLVMALALWGIG